jgi:hypothetical protein
MADAKKPEPKPREKPAEVIIKLIIWALIGGAIAQRIGAFVTAYNENNLSVSSTVSSWSLSQFVLSYIVPFLTFVSYAFSAAAIFGAIYAFRGLTKINEAVNAIYADSGKTEEIIVDQKGNRRWERVVSHLNSTSVNDWKFAILEADIILDELLDATGYRGETVSDKLKRVEASDFETLEFAWEAHKVRNTIAHEGSEFVISEREARRVIGLYQAVFEEFHYI